MGESVLKVVVGDGEFILDKPDVFSQCSRVISVSPSNSVLSAGLKVGALVTSVGRIPLSGLKLEELQSLINDSISSGELRLKVIDNKNEISCSFPVETGKKAICITINKATEITSDNSVHDNLRIIHRQAYRSSPDSVRTQRNLNVKNNSFEKPNLQINYKPKHASTCSPVTGTCGSHLGAVARLAIDGGLTADQLLQIGSSEINQPGHYLYQSGTSYDQKRLAPDSKCSSLHSQDANFSTTHSASPYPHICRISPRRTRRPIYNSCSQSVHLVRSPGTATRHDQPYVSISPTHTTHYNSRLSQCTTSHDNPSTWHMSNSSRVPFPAQMTRVGGIIFSTGSSNIVSENSSLNSIGKNIPTSKPYQSVSACTSPTNLKHTVSCHSPSGTFFSCSNVPSSTNTPPLAPNITDNIGATDIVRLGPGNIVTRAPAGSSTYSPSSLIRMHCSPQPYVGMAITGDPCVPVVSTLTISNLNVPSSVSLDEDDSCLYPKPTINSEPNIPTTYSDVETNRTLEPIFPCSTSSPSPTEMSPLIVNRPVTKKCYVNPSLRSSAPVTSSQYIPVSERPFTDSFLPHPKPLNSHNSPSSQIVRTVRHLRRIRHIFGDSIGYTSSVTSASTSALADEDKDSLCSPKVGQLRSHGYHSVESVRRSSLLCDCSPNQITNLNDRKCVKISNSNPSYPVVASIHFNNSETEVSKKSLIWCNYQMTLTGQTLVLTRENDSSIQVPTRHTVTNENSVHIHIPLTGESLDWYLPSEVPDITCSSSLPSDCDTETGVIGVLHSSKLNLTCYLNFPHRQIACDIFDRFGPQKMNEDSKKKHSTTHSSQTSLPSHSLHHKLSSGRSSLGLAGPSGVAPLFKAVGTAAASVGMQLSEYVNFQGLLQSNRQALSSVSSSQTSAVAGNGDISKLKSGQTTKNKSSDPSDSIAQPSKSKELRFLPSFPRGRGRLHQALTRIRRAATASCDPTNRSSSSVTTRRFASTHGFGKNKSISISSPVQASTECINSSSKLKNSYNLSSESHDINNNSQLTLLMATSVSPSLSLQTPCLTFLQIESKDSVNTNSDLYSFPQGSHECLYKEASHNPDAQDNQQSRKQHKSHSQLTVVVSDSVDHDVNSESSIVQSTSSQSEYTLFVQSTHPFIPLPVQLSNPLPLHKCPRSTLSPFVPFVVELCVTLVERFGLNCIGIYRLSGSKVAHDFITSELSRDISAIDVTSDKWNDLHAVCGVLKTFLRNLPDSLFPKVMYQDFLAACRLPQREKRLLSIQRLLSIMECYPCHPEYRAHRATLRYLVTHLARVSAREGVNKMTAYNLALVFAPNLVQPCEDTPELLMSDSKYKIKLVETVIKYHAWIFSPDLGLESGCSVPPDSAEDLTLEIDVNTATSKNALCDSSTTDSSEDSVHQPGRLEGDVQPLVAELLTAAASLPPPPSDTDLETAEIPGPESDRPSDIIMSRPRFTSIPTSSNNWLSSLTNISTIQSGGGLPDELSTTSTVTASDNVSTLKVKTNLIIDSKVLSDVVDHKKAEGHHLPDVANLRHLSQGCIEKYTSEARRLGDRVAESRRVLESTVAQRLHAEQLLFEARIECSESFVMTSQKPQNDSSGELIIHTQNVNDLSASVHSPITVATKGNSSVSEFENEKSNCTTLFCCSHRLLSRFGAETCFFQRQSFPSDYYYYSLHSMLNFVSKIWKTVIISCYNLFTLILYKKYTCAYIQISRYIFQILIPLVIVFVKSSLYDRFIVSPYIYMRTNM
ncbi:Rho GTPase-activating protein 100F [Schistosoma japonicum]|nr:Rho GTPase-activating protein 100F [Schistosoma japonicum]